MLPSVVVLFVLEKCFQRDILLKNFIPMNIKLISNLRYLRIQNVFQTKFSKQHNLHYVYMAFLEEKLDTLL